MRARYFGVRLQGPEWPVCCLIIEKYGSLAPAKLRRSHVIEIDETLKKSGLAHSTRVTKANALKRILRWLWETHGAEKLDDCVSRYPGLRPRNVVVRDDERTRILAAATPPLRLWLLFCSDLAIRSGTAYKLGPEHYDAGRQELVFVTKYGENLTLPVTEEIAALLAECNLKYWEPFVAQLRRRYWGWSGLLSEQQRRGMCNSMHRHFRLLLQSLEITRKLRPHDLRRTAAVRLYKATGDLRDVQSFLGHRSLNATLWYLDHDLRPMERKTLELIKRPVLERKSA